MSLEAAAVTIRGFLFADVFAYLRTCSNSKLTVDTAYPRAQKCSPVKFRSLPHKRGHRYGALPFQKSDHRGHRILRRDRDAHVHMVRQRVSLHDLALLLPRQCVEYFSQLAPCLAKQHLAPPLGHKHHMILTVPTGMR